MHTRVPTCVIGLSVHVCLCVDVCVCAFVHGYMCAHACVHVHVRTCVCILGGPGGWGVHGPGLISSQWPGRSLRGFPSQRWSLMTAPSGKCELLEAAPAVQGGEGPPEEAGTQIPPSVMHAALRGLQRQEPPGRERLSSIKVTVCWAPRDQCQSQSGERGRGPPGLVTPPVSSPASAHLPLGLWFWPLLFLESCPRTPTLPFLGPLLEYLGRNLKVCSRSLSPAKQICCFGEQKCP